MTSESGRGDVRPRTSRRARAARRMALACGLLVGLLASPSSPPSLVGMAWAQDADPSLRAADAAFDAGDHDKALELYEALLARDPDQRQALVRSAMLRSWKSDFEPALARYDRVLELDPDARNVRVQRAEVLSWAKRYDRAAAEFRRVLAEAPHERRARIGLARALSWGGAQRAARGEYERVLNERPGDIEATVGMAQTYAWSGDLITARDWYARALATEVQDKNAQLGMAYVELWSGEPRAAGTRAEELARRFPSDREVIELQRAIGRPQGPDVRVANDWIEDTDDNELVATRVDATWVVRGRDRLRLGLARWGMQGVRGDSHSVALDAAYGWRLAPAQTLTARGGVDWAEDSRGDRRSTALYGLAYNATLRGGWNAGASFQHDPFRYSTAILDNDIDIDALRVEASGPLSDRWRLDLNASTWRLSDRNRRHGLEAGLWYRWPVRATNVATGALLRSFAYDKNRDNGYFDPRRYGSGLLAVRVFGPFGASKFYYDLWIEGGSQSFSPHGQRAIDDDRVLSGSLLLGIPIVDPFALEFFANHSEYALQNASGFESDQLGVRLRYAPGGRR